MSVAIEMDSEFQTREQGENRLKSVTPSTEKLSLYVKVALAALRIYKVYLSIDRKSTRLNSSHESVSRMPSSA